MDVTINRVDYTWYPEDPSGDRYRRDDDTDGDGDLDRVEYEGDFDYSEAFPNHSGLEVVLMSGVGSGNGTTDLTIPDAFVFAGNGDSATPVRIEGGGVDTLRFDMDDFTEADRADIDGEEYRSFAADDATWSFIVDVDVVLFDIWPCGLAQALADPVAAYAVGEEAHMADATNRTIKRFHLFLRPTEQSGEQYAVAVEIAVFARERAEFVCHKAGDFRIGCRLFWQPGSRQDQPVCPPALFVRTAPGWSAATSNTIAGLAREEVISDRHVSRVIRLAWLLPSVLERLVPRGSPNSGRIVQQSPPEIRIPIHSLVRGSHIGPHADVAGVRAGGAGRSFHQLAV